MKLTLEPTSKIVTLVINGAEVPARIWQGQDETGTPCHAYITRVAVHKDEPAEAQQRFADALQECAAPRPNVQAIDLRFIID